MPPLFQIREILQNRERTDRMPEVNPVRTMDVLCFIEGIVALLDQPIINPRGLATPNPDDGSMLVLGFN